VDSDTSYRQSCGSDIIVRKLDVLTELVSKGCRNCTLTKEVKRLRLENEELNTLLKAIIETKEG
jgi:hypothetical protein